MFGRVADVTSEELEHLSENTVKSHLSHIFGKLNVQSRAEAVTVALQRGLVSLDR